MSVYMKVANTVQYYSCAASRGLWAASKGGYTYFSMLADRLTLNFLVLRQDRTNLIGSCH
jgi:hypothetical protein